MPDFRKVTDDFSVSPQLSLEDVDAAAAAGFGMIISNSHDGEVETDLPDMAEIGARAESLGLVFHALPYTGAPGAELVREQAAIMQNAKGPVLAYCRTGTRAILIWALAQSQDDLDMAITAGTNAGYDLSTLLSYM